MAHKKITLSIYLLCLFVHSLNEFRAVLRVAVPGISKSELNEMLHDMDINQDGTIDYKGMIDRAY